MEVSTIIFIVVLIASVIIHEVSHGYTAYFLGDNTAKLAGRLTLNPLPHIDLLGSIIIPAFLVLSNSPIMFGWAKPVPYNPYNLKRGGKFAEGLVALAGPLSNILLALFFALLYKTSFISSSIALQVIYMNLFLALINLVPIPPLDGSKILPAFLPHPLDLKLNSLFRSIEQGGVLTIFIAVFVLATLLAEPISKFVLFLSALFLSL